MNTTECGLQCPLHFSCVYLFRERNDVLSCAPPRTLQLTLEKELKISGNDNLTQYLCLVYNESILGHGSTLLHHANAVSSTGPFRDAS